MPGQVKPALHIGADVLPYFDDYVRLRTERAGLNGQTAVLNGLSCLQWKIKSE